MKNWIIPVLLIATTKVISAQSTRINEIMYGPKGGEPEWIEFYNTSENAVDLKGWKIRNHIERWYTMTDSDFLVLPDSFAVLTKSDTILSFHSINRSEILVCPDLPTSFFNNAGDTISIHDSTDALVDSVFYHPSWGGGNGKSLERVSTELSPFLSSTWGTSSDTAGSTPGRPNSIAAFDYDLAIKSFLASMSLSNSVVTFNVMVVNRGVHSTSPFGLKISVDLDGDGLCQPDEIVSSIANIAGLVSGDSIAVVTQVNLPDSYATEACVVIDFTSDENPANDSMWTRIQTSYQPKSLVINEVMYHPGKGEPEWVELYNASPYVINLFGFTVGDNSGTKAVISSSDFLLQVNGFALVAHDSSFFTFHPTSTANVLISKIPSLNDTGDDVVIHDATGTLIDSVEYSPSWGGNTGGKSLERILPAGESSDPQNWETCTDSSGSTPGRINSVTPGDFDLAIGTISYSPAQLESGGTATLHAPIINTGLKISGPAAAKLFNDSDENGMFETQEQISSLPIPPILPGDSAFADFQVERLCAGVHHFGVFVDYPEDQLKSNNTKTLTFSVGLPPGSIVVNEIMYAPVSPEQEWLELYNTTDTIIDLSDFKIETHGGSKSIMTGSIIAPEGYAVMCKDSSVSRLHYPVANQVYQSPPSLSNSGDWITLSDNLGNLIDSVSYVPSYGGAHGKSLERIDCLSGSDSTNWCESVDSTGATPGSINSTARLPYDVCLYRIDCPTAMKPNESGTIRVVVQNSGRNPVANFEVSVEIFSKVDGKSAFSEKRTISENLASADSALIEFNFDPSTPGSYRIVAKIFQPQDQSSRNDTLSTELSVRYGAGSIVINEIMFTKSSTGDYFEVFNASQNPIDLSGWTFHTGTSQHKSFHYSTTPLLLSPDAYFVVAGDSSILTFVPDTDMVHIVSTLALKNDGDCIVVTDPAGTVVDSVYYLPSWHNADIGNTTGRSLERINPSLLSNDKSSWSTSVSQLGGTPGGKNSIYVAGGDAGNPGSISVSPNPFSPDGDGVDDFTFIDYSFPGSSVKVRVRIFDSIGRLIATPVDNAVMSSTGKLVWDGRDGSGKIVKFGLYVLLVEISGPNGNGLSVFKKPLVVAKRMR